MSGEAIAAILTAAATFIGGVALAARGMLGDRAGRKSAEAAALLSGYTEMVKSLRTEITELREQGDKALQAANARFQAELENQAALHDRERKRWDEERERTDEKIELLEAQLAAALFRADGKL